MKGALVAAMLTLVACSNGTTPVASASPSSRPSPTDSAVANSSPSSTSVPTVLMTINCRLPVSWGILEGQSVTHKAGFLNLAEHTLVEDARAPAGSRFYDRAPATWLPVNRSAVSPNGKRYAYGEGSAMLGTAGKLHLVDVGTGVDRVIYNGGLIFEVVDFAAEGIYLTSAAPEGRPQGLWVINPDGGAPRLISSTLEGPEVGGGAAWGVDFNAADPHPAPGGIEGPMNRVVRLDLRTGATAHWFYRPGADVYLLGIDSAGRPFVSASFEQSNLRELWQIQSATTATKLFAGTPDRGPGGLAAIDAHGMWFSGQDLRGVWLYAGGSMKLVATVANVDSFDVAGGCIP
jgi:hypothetical protein